MTTPIRFAQIEPTTRCNYKCGFCAGRSMRQGDLQWDDFEGFLAMNPSLEHVELQGEGEPLLHPRFFDMVSACRERGIRVSIITNGSLLSKDVVERLISAGIESIHVSLETTDPTDFKAIRGGKFEKVVSGLRLLMRQRRERGYDFPAVGFCVTVLRRTMDAIHEIVALYQELELDGGISVQQLQNQKFYTDRYSSDMRNEMIPTDHWQNYSWVIEAAVRQARVRDGFLSYYGALFAEFDPTSRQCPWLKHGTFLNVDGAVTGCCFMKNPKDSFGHPKSDTHERINARRHQLAEAIARGEVPTPCEGCGVANLLTMTPRQDPPNSLPSALGGAKRDVN